MRPRYGYWLAGRACDEGAWLEVRDKFTGERLTEVATASPAAIERAIQAASQAREPLRRMAACDRRAVLDHCVDRIREREDEFAEALCAEAGKPIRDSRGEVVRLLETFQAAAEESVRVGGEVVPLDGSPRARGYRGYLKRVPVGVCSFIAPFNFPLNLVAHKVAPALAEVNASAFGLQAGIFTRDLYRAQQAWDELEVGGVVVGDVPSWRSDTMPYGGVKDSGLGREGVRYAMEDMTEPRLLVVRTPPGS